MRQEWVGKRTALRQPCSISAEIHPHDGHPSFPCTIIEISNTGARITISDEDVLPDLFDLHVSIRDETKPARIVRRHPGFIAIAFLKPREADRMMMASLIERVTELEAHALNRQPIQPVGPLQDLIQRVSLMEQKMTQAAADAADLRALVDAAVANVSTAAEQLSGMDAAQTDICARLSAVAQAIPSDPRPDILSLRNDLDDLLERMTRQIPATATIAQLATAVEQLHQSIGSLAPRSELEALRQQLCELKAMGRMDTPPVPDDITREVASLRSSVQALIILVSKSIGRPRSAA